MRPCFSRSKQSFVTSVLVGLLGLVSIQCYADELSKQQQELKQLKQQLATLEKTISDEKARFNAQQKHLKAEELKISQITKQQHRLKKALKEKKALLAKHQRSFKNKQKNYKQEIALAKQQILAQHQLKHRPAWKILLSQQDASQFARLKHYYNVINTKQAASISQSQQALASLAEAEDVIKTETEALESLNQTIEKQARTLKAQQAKKQAILTAIGKDIAKHQTAHTVLTENAQQLTTLITKIKAAKPSKDNIPRLSQHKGQLRWPTQGRLLHQFGESRQGTLRWEGVFIAARQGNSVKPIHPGKIVFADWIRGFGLITIIDHFNGYMSLYAHNQSLLKSVGDWVNPEDEIALTGQSGTSPQSGLYFELRHHGKPINPSAWLSKKS